MVATKSNFQTPQQRAIIATIAVFLLLAIFAFAGFWYGKNNSETGSSSSKNSNSTALNSNTGTSTKPETIAISGKITKVSKDSVEIQIASGETARTLTANISKDTLIRKLDFRSIPKNGFGDGVAIKQSDLKVGLNVVILTKDTSADTVNAQKVSMLIYP
ncbi:MAG: hypothetical protein WCT08_02960 [Patescibacteria group bacterium]|jgi:hypothetical protein